MLLTRRTERLQGKWYKQNKHGTIRMKSENISKMPEERYINSPDQSLIMDN
jgi:hypothetical protein